MLYDRGIDVAFPATVRRVSQGIRDQLAAVRSAASAAA